MLTSLLGAPGRQMPNLPDPGVSDPGLSLGHSNLAPHCLMVLQLPGHPDIGPLSIYTPV